MKDIKIVIGTNFGDEGKGKLTDYYTKMQITVSLCVQMAALREDIQY